MNGKTLLKSLFGGMARRKQRLRHAHFLYGMVVASARDPDLFRRFEIPDTFDGRFEMLLTHLYVLNKRLRRDGENGRALSQEVFDIFIDDMDSALRELAVGDQVVPKRLAKMSRVIHGRVSAYDRALESDENPNRAVAQVIARNVFDNREPLKPEFEMSRWIQERIKALEARPLQDFLIADDIFASNTHEELT